MINVQMIEKVPENCATCLYKSRVGLTGCAHADRKEDWPKYALIGWKDNGCPSYWLDQRRFIRADGMRRI